MTGWKTYAVAGLMGVATVAQAMGWIDQQTFVTIMGILNGGGFAALRAGVKSDIKNA